MTADGTPTPRTGETITDASELDALPVGLVLRTVRGYLTEIVLDDRGRRYVRATPDMGGDGGWYTHSERVLDMLPLTVLFRPDAPQPATTDDAVERAARAWHQEAERQSECLMGEWDALYPDDRARALQRMRAALAAAGAREAVDREAVSAAIGSAANPTQVGFGVVGIEKAIDAVLALLAARGAATTPSVTAEQRRYIAADAVRRAVRAIWDVRRKRLGLDPITDFDFNDGAGGGYGDTWAEAEAAVRAATGVQA